MLDVPVAANAEWEHYSLQLPSEARRIAAEAAIDAPDPFTVGDGLTELLLNAIEHGNLEIGTQHKGELLREGRWREEVERRLCDPVLGRRRVQMITIKTATDLTFIITDDGQGFDYRSQPEQPPAGALNGRGIKLARDLSFDRLEFKGKGNIAIAQVLL